MLLPEDYDLKHRWKSEADCEGKIKGTVGLLQLAGLECWTFLNVPTQHNWLKISHTFFIACLFASSWYLRLHKLHVWHVVFLLKSDKQLGKPNNDYSNKFLSETLPDQFVLLFYFFFPHWDICTYMEQNKNKWRLWLLGLFIFADQFSAWITLVVILMCFGC